MQDKYLSKLNEQEDEVSKLDAEKQGLEDKRQAKAAELNQKIAALSF